MANNYSQPFYGFPNGFPPPQMPPPPGAPPEEQRAAPPLQQLPGINFNSYAHNSQQPPFQARKSPFFGHTICALPCLHYAQPPGRPSCLPTQTYGLSSRMAPSLRPTCPRRPFPAFLHRRFLRHRRISHRLPISPSHSHSGLHILPLHINHPRLHLHSPLCPHLPTNVYRESWIATARMVN